MPDFNPSRLVVARKRRGVTKKALAESASISTRSLTAYENGAREPTPLTLLRISEALEFPVAFLAGPDLDEPPLGAVSFRALSNLTAKQRDQASGSVTLALAFLRWIAARFTLPEPDIPRVRGVETAAEAVRRAWGMGERPVRNMIHVLEAHGVRVLSLPEECAQIDAFSFWKAGEPYVFLNTMKSAERSRMDAAHELGHLTLHWGHETPRGREMEREAQAFGAAFLMPRGSVLAQAPRSGSLNQLIAAKLRWNVSVANLAYRMHTLGLLSDWQYRTIFIEISQKGYRRSEPSPVHGETSQVFAKVFKALGEEHISKADIAASLNIPIEELHRMVFGLVLTPIDGNGRGPISRGPYERPKLSLV